MEVSAKDQLLLDDDALLGLDWNGGGNKKSCSSVDLDSDEEDCLLEESSTCNLVNLSDTTPVMGGVCNYSLPQHQRDISKSHFLPKTLVRETDNPSSKAISESNYQSTIKQKHTNFQDFSFSTNNCCLILPPARTNPYKPPATYNRQSLGYKTEMSSTMDSSNSSNHYAHSLVCGNQDKHVVEGVSVNKSVPEENKHVEERKVHKIIKLTGSKKFRYVPSGLMPPTYQQSSRISDRRIKRVHY